ncbi:MAG: hypothetical protein GY714_23560 [Desulfobacterales bacterium]|nr:hypothetical protein [Desulfobacterales bacterium]
MKKVLKIKEWEEVKSIKSNRLSDTYYKGLDQNIKKSNMHSSSNKFERRKYISHGWICLGNGNWKTAYNRLKSD